MWKLALCMFYLYRSLDGSSFGEQMAETSQICCDKGRTYARNHTQEDCSSAVPPPVPYALGSVCTLAMDGCCREYFQKKRECDTGIDFANELHRCDDATAITAKCCNECLRGTAEGAQIDCAETEDSGATADEDVLSRRAYTQCCKNTAKKRKGVDTAHANSILLTKKDDLHSICDDYAPHELCAHHCIPIPGSFKCVCEPGYKLMADGRNCIEVVKNRCKPKNPCEHKCNDDGVSVKCSCKRGYELMADGKSCQDIDECSIDPPICLPQAKCYNLQGSYKCVSDKNEKGQCPPGYKRNSANGACDDINECELKRPPCPIYLCENTVGGYKCGGTLGNPTHLNNNNNQPATEERCPQGFKAGTDEECEDENECELHRDNCNPLSQFCINTRGSFHCQDIGSTRCPPGFHIDPDTKKCEDIDECEDSQNVCSKGYICVNTLGEYDCKAIHDESIQHCSEGMRLKPGSNICEDIDECLEGVHLCDPSQNCLNTNGSYECICKIGYKLDPSSGTCTDINECATGHHSCLQEVQRCDNTVGSYLCVRILSCGTGYVLQHTTGQCEDIDECALGKDDCKKAGNDYQCINIPGAFICEKGKKSTTAVPEYEYYYDSDEEIDNQTSIEVDTTATTTTTTTTTSQASVTVISSKPTPLPVPETPVPEIPIIEPPQENSIDGDLRPELEPEKNVPTISEPKQPVTYSLNPYIPADTPNETPKPPDNKFNEAKEDNGQTYSVNQPDISYNTISNSDNENSSPTIVYLPETQEYSTEKKEIYKQPENPRKCQNGFEVDDYGACFDIDECATNRHSCSGLTEVCRNTMGGYICDCAYGFRRDLSTGACDMIITTPPPRPTQPPPPPPSPAYPSHQPPIQAPSIQEQDSTIIQEPDQPVQAPDLPPINQPFLPPIEQPDIPTEPPHTSPITPPTIPSTTESTTSTTSSTTTPVPPPSTQRHNFWGPDHRFIKPFRSRNLCDVGYHLNSQTRICEDIDECKNGQANCAAVEICVNTLGGYRCECLPHWRLDDVKHQCVPERWIGRFPPGYENKYEIPQTPPLVTVEVGNKGPTYEPDITHHDTGSIFKCPRGYRLGYDNTCEDIDECASGIATCGPVQRCVNQPGGYMCSCPPGHRLAADHVCEDIDECTLAGNRPICSQNADCVNTVGSYKCVCHEGFTTAPANHKVCIDIDECVEARTGSLCEHRCNNVWGSYRCSCHRGYRLNADNKTCADVDECSEYKPKRLCIGYCQNEPGSYRCRCPSGYRLSEDKKSCIDVNECDTGEAPCAASGVSVTNTYRDICVNTRGAYKCHRITCPNGYKLEDNHRCKRIEQYCHPGDWECAHQPTTYSYNFITFVSNLYIPNEKVDLFTMKGPKWPLATMKFELRLVNVNAPPSVKEKADFNAFLLIQTNYDQAMLSLTKPLQGPQSVELELSMELYDRGQFGGIAVAKIFIYVSEHEF